MVSYITSALIQLPFLIVVLHTSGTRKALGSWLDNIEVYLTPLLILNITRLQDKGPCRYLEYPIFTYSKMIKVKCWLQNWWKLEVVWLKLYDQHVVDSYQSYKCLTKGMEYMSIVNIGHYVVALVPNYFTQVTIKTKHNVLIKNPLKLDQNEKLK